MNELTPIDYGLLGMVYPIFLFWGLISNFSLDRSIITKPEISTDELSTLFWTKLGFSSVILLFFLILKYPLILFYNESRLGIIIEFFALVILLQSTTDVFKAILYRHFLFKKMALVELTAVSLSSATALYLASAGWSYKALIAKEVLLSILLLLFTGLASQWLPQFRFNKTFLVTHWNFGKNITTARMLNYFSRNLDDILTGKKFGSSALGLYTKSYALLTLPLTIISKSIVTAVLPSMPQYHKETFQANEKYQQAVRSVLALNTPLCLIIFFNASHLINLILPTDWDGTIPLIQLFCVLSIFQAVGPLNDLVYEGMNKSEKIVKYTILCHAITITGIIFGFIWGKNVYELALFYVVGNFITFIVNQYFIAKMIKMPLVDLFRNMSPYFISGIITFIVMFMLSDFMNILPNVSNVIASVLLILSLYFCSIFFFFSKDYQELKSAAIRLLKW